MASLFHKRLLHKYTHIAINTIWISYFYTCFQHWSFYALFPEVAYCSQWQHSAILCSSLCRVVALWTFPIHSRMAVVVHVQLMFEQSCWGDFMGLASDIARRQSLSKFLDTLDITSILFSLLLCSLSLGWCVSLDASIVIGLHNSAFWLVVVFCSGHTLYMTFELLSFFF